MFSRSWYGSHNISEKGCKAARIYCDAVYASPEARTTPTRNETHDNAKLAGQDPGFPVTEKHRLLAKLYKHQQGKFM